MIAMGIDDTQFGYLWDNWSVEERKRWAIHALGKGTKGKLRSINSMSILVWKRCVEIYPEYSRRIRVSSKLQGGEREVKVEPFRY